MKQYPIEVVEMARRLYHEGVTLPRIAEDVSETTGRHCTAKAVWNWAKKYEWVRPNKKTGRARERALRVTEEKRKIEVSETSKQLAAYKAVWGKGADALDSVPIRTADEAARLVDTGIKGQRRIEMDNWKASFLGKLAEILRDEIQDYDILKKIVARFKTELTNFEES